MQPQHAAQPGGVAALVSRQGRAAQRWPGRRSSVLPLAHLQLPRPDQRPAAMPPLQVGARLPAQLPAAGQPRPSLLLRPLHTRGLAALAAAARWPQPERQPQRCRQRCAGSAAGRLAGGCRRPRHHCHGGHHSRRLCGSGGQLERRHSQGARPCGRCGSARRRRLCRLSGRRLRVDRQGWCCPAACLQAGTQAGRAGERAWPSKLRGHSPGGSHLPSAIVSARPSPPVWQATATRIWRSCLVSLLWSSCGRACLLGRQQKRRCGAWHAAGRATWVPWWRPLGMGGTAPRRLGGTFLTAWPALPLAAGWRWCTCRRCRPAGAAGAAGPAGSGRHDGRRCSGGGSGRHPLGAAPRPCAAAAPAARARCCSCARWDHKALHEDSIDLLFQAVMSAAVGACALPVAASWRPDGGRRSSFQTGAPLIALQFVCKGINGALHSRQQRNWRRGR